MVQSYGNGKYTIKNIEEDLFLGWQEQTKDVFKVGKNIEERIWSVNHVGGYTYV